MRPSNDPSAIAQYKRDYQDLLGQPNMADLDAFVRWLTDCDDWDGEGAEKISNDVVRVRFSSFDELWCSYCFACLDMEMQAVPHSVLQNEWKNVGMTDRPNRSRKNPHRLVNYLIDIRPAVSNVVRFGAAA